MLVSAGWQTILDNNGQYQGQLFIKVVYRPYQEDSGPRQWECPETYFPMRTENEVTLYSCARNSDTQHSIPISCSTGSSSSSSQLTDYSPPSLWIDIFKAIVESQRFIYLAGWSLNTSIKLLRRELNCSLI